MRNLNDLNRYRDKSRPVIGHYGTAGDENGGVFRVPSGSTSHTLLVIASKGGGWDHISVSKMKRPPSWAEMEQIKRLFFADDEVAMQLHVKPSDHINAHYNCLHLWRPMNAEIPLPPLWMIA